MKLAAMICEFNPLHNGHLLAIAHTKKRTACDGFVALMSGNFTERGDIAILDKYERARHAIMAGADIVIELPVCYATSSADKFAEGGVKLLSAWHDVKFLSFGSECGDIDSLDTVANLLVDEPDDFKQYLNSILSSGVNYPTALSQALTRHIITNDLNIDSDLLRTSNNTLGIEYLKAIKRLGSDLAPFTFMRAGDDYNSTDINSMFPSATAIRQCVLNGNRPDGCAPSYVLDDLEGAKATNDKLYEMLAYSISVRSNLQLGEIYDMKEGLNNKFRQAILTSTCYDDLINAVKSKRYTLARIKRLALYCLLNLTSSYYETCIGCPPYYRILAVKKDRTDILASIADAGIPTLKRLKDNLTCPISILPSTYLDDTADRIYSIVSHKQVGTSTLFI